MNAQAHMVDELRRLPCFDDDMFISSLKTDLPAYLVAAAEVGVNVDRGLWWKRHSQALPYILAERSKASIYTVAIVSSS